MVWASCEVQDCVAQTTVREKWELSVIPWYYHFLFSPYLCLSLPQGHLQSCLITSAVYYQRSSWDVLCLSTSLSCLLSSLYCSYFIARVSCSLHLSLLSGFLLSPINHSFLSCPIPSRSVLGTVFSCYLHSISHWIYCTLSFALEVDKCEVGRFVGCFCYCYCCQIFWCHYLMKTQTELHSGVMKRKSPWLTTWQPIVYLLLKKHLYKFTMKPYKKQWGGTMVQRWHLMITVVLCYE